MKKYLFPIDQFQADVLFSPIRTRQEAIFVLMRTLKIMLVNQPPPEKQVVGEIILHVSKMSRVFFVSRNKIFSLAFPFFVLENEGVFSFKSHYHSGLTHKVTSDILSLLDSKKVFESAEVFDFAESIDDVASGDTEVWSLLRELLTGEDGYIRYDFDEKNENGDMHPTHHYDIFFSSNVTFKLGLQKKIACQEMIDMLDHTTSCHYLNQI